MKKERKEESFLKKPWYKGGNSVMAKFIQANLTYPKEAAKHKIEGVVRVRVNINYKGLVEKATVTSGIGYGCDEEAIRIVKLLRFEVEKTPRKLKVTYHKNLNIHFKLPKRVTKPVTRPSVGYTYTIKTETSNKNQDDVQPQKHITTYSYTINIK